MSNASADLTECPQNDGDIATELIHSVEPADEAKFLEKGIVKSGVFAVGLNIIVGIVVQTKSMVTGSE